jgi:TRAP-type C4-dicarboxylate transport system substrate-binding protein
MSRIVKPSRRRFVQTATAAGAVTAFGVPLLAKAAPEHTLKIATLAPDGSSWHKAFKSVARQIKERTDGAVVVKIYGGGVMGDESAMVRKMRTGQLDGAAVTSVGLGDINQQLLMLQLPLLFRDYDQLDKVRTGMKSKFDQLLLDGGFIRSGDGDVGFAYLFSNTPIAVPSDAKDTKMWVWDADPVSKETMKVAGINAVPLGVPDVLSSLQTGIIDAFPNSPYGAIALQWYTKAQYITNLKLSMSIGGSVLSVKSWNKIKSEHQQIIQEITEETHTKLLKRIRRDNTAAVQTLKDKGIQVVQPKDIEAWKKLAKTVRQNLTGSLFDKALVDEMMGYLS